MPRQGSSRIALPDAEALALQVLAFLLSDPTRLQRFMSLTGLAPAELRAATEARHLQAATLDYLLTDESLLLMFCQEAGADPMTIAPAHAVLVNSG